MLMVAVLALVAIIAVVVTVWSIKRPPARRPTRSAVGPRASACGRCPPGTASGRAP